MPLLRLGKHEMRRRKQVAIERRIALEAAALADFEQMEIPEAPIEPAANLAESEQQGGTVA